MSELYFLIASSECAVSVYQFLCRGDIADDDVVAVHDDKGIVADKGTRSRYRVTEPLSLDLSDVMDIRELMKVLNGPELFCFACFSQSIFQTCGNVEMIFDNAFAAVGDDQDIGDT